jgi:prepilin-type N-terminal cleavage/methylation domain-containing protein
MAHFCLRRRAFTLVELLVVIAIIGLLTGLLLPAVQAAREAARRAQCQNHLKNQALAVLNFEQTKKIIPPGNMLKDETGFSWMYQILPYIEQGQLYEQFNPKQPWDSPENTAAVHQKVGIYRCPNSLKEFDGETDYTGINSTIVGWEPPADMLERGTFIDVTKESAPITLASITDGLSNTIGISEATDREPDDGLWAAGVSTLMHSGGGVNSSWNGIYSFHPGGAMAARVDGSCTFLPVTMDEITLGALLTRSGQETVTVD